MKKFCILMIVICLFLCTGCHKNTTAAEPDGRADTDCVYTEYSLERNGIALHLDRVSAEGTASQKSILLIHGVTYSSHEFDIDYKDYSLVRKLAREGYDVWRLDIAGFGQSESVPDGFLPDSVSFGKSFWSW